MQLHALVCEPAHNTHLNFFFVERAQDDMNTGKPVYTTLNGCVESALLLCANAF